MKIYQDIKNPIDTKEGLLKILDAYFSDLQDSFYSRVVNYGGENERFNKKEFYKFKRYVNGKNLDLLRDINIEKIKKYNKITSNTLLSKILCVFSPGRRYVNSIKTEFPTLEQYNILQKYTNKQILDIYSELEKRNPACYNYEEELILNMFKNCIDTNNTHYGTAGFHVNSPQLEKNLNVDDKEYPEFKIYLNLNYDQLYKFAQKYMEICKNNNIPYLFKVMSPIKDVPSRSEKMCIYCHKENFYKTIEIIRAIKKTNPELKVYNPPIMAGILDGWIGIGCENEHSDSYNAIRAECIENALKNYFKRMDNKQAKNYIKEHPSCLSEIRSVIIDTLKKNKISPDKICFTEENAEKIRQQDKLNIQYKLKLNPKELRINWSDGQKKSQRKRSSGRLISDEMFEEYANTRLFFGKESAQVEEIVKRITKNIQTQRAMKRNNKRKIKRNYTKKAYPKFPQFIK